MPSGASAITSTSHISPEPRIPIPIAVMLADCSRMVNGGRQDRGHPTTHVWFRVIILFALSVRDGWRAGCENRDHPPDA
jgi:hypothetical protein